MSSQLALILIAISRDWALQPRGGIRFPMPWMLIFLPNSNRTGHSSVLSLRRELGIGPNDLVLLWSAKMTPVKAPFLLVEALAALPEAVRRRFWFVAMGDGPLRQSFEAQLKGLLPGRTRFLGFCNQSEIGRGYAMADALVFPSTQGETWGLVVNEALQFGLAVMASDHPGCVADLLGFREIHPFWFSCFPQWRSQRFCKCSAGVCSSPPRRFQPSAER